MTTFNQIEKFDVGFDFMKGQPIPDETETIVAFHTLIQRQGLGDTLIDVANYLHVTTGPGILLIGHQAFRTVQIDQAKAGIILSGRRMKGIFDYVIPWTTSSSIGRVRSRARSTFWTYSLRPHEANNPNQRPAVQIWRKQCSEPPLSGERRAGGNRFEVEKT